MVGISEALVATAVGLFVALPAVVRGVSRVAIDIEKEQWEMRSWPQPAPLLLSAARHARPGPQ